MIESPTQQGGTPYRVGNTFGQPSDLVECMFSNPGVRELHVGSEVFDFIKPLIEDDIDVPVIIEGDFPASKWSVQNGEGQEIQKGFLYGGASVRIPPVVDP